MEIPILGNDQEVKTFQDVIGHYKISQEDLTQRIDRKNGFTDADKMFASYIAEGDWPYSSMIYDPRPYTTILEKSARLIGSKPRGRLVPREGGDTLGAYVNNELLDFEWDYNACLGETMIAKWIMMDQNTRKYGSAFGLVPWRWDQRVMDGKRKTYYDGPDFRVLNNRDVLKNPSYTYINKWFQLREWKTLDELENINDAARSAPIYKNLSQLRDAIKASLGGKSKGRGDQRSSKYTIPNKSIKGLTDYMGRDEVYKTVEVVTEYRPERWITFAPRYGVVIRDIPNPYKHGEIPVVELKYYPLPDDAYGQSELEPISKLVRGLNAHLSSYSDRVALRLRPPVMVNPTSVHMNTLEWTPEAKWLMNKPGQDVMNMPMGGSEDGAFQNVYNVFLGAIMNAVGEQSQGSSSVNPTQDQGRVTATEIKDSAFTRNVRDNMNQIFLSEALKKQIMFWHSMNQQFLFAGKTEKAKVIRIVGKDAIAFFNRQGLGDIRPTEQDIANEALYNPTGEGPSSYVPGPRFPVTVGDQLKPKFEADTMGEGGNLYIEPGDLIGEYDYIPDIESMKAPSDADIEQKMMMVVGMVTNPAVMQMMAAEGKKPKITEIVMRAIEATHVIKDAEGLFEDVQGGGLNGQGQTLPGGIPGAAPGQPPQGANGAAGMAGGPPPMAPGQNQALMAGPPGNPVGPGPGIPVQNGMGMG